MISKQKATELIANTLAETAAEIGFVLPESITPQTTIFGEGSPLDSMGLVILIADLEAVISRETGLALILADERAMSRSKSPFRSVETLADFVVELASLQSDN